MDLCQAAGYDRPASTPTISPGGHRDDNEYCYEPDNFLTQPGYNIVNAQVKLALSDALAVRVWGKNLLGEN